MLRPISAAASLPSHLRLGYGPLIPVSLRDKLPLGKSDEISPQVHRPDRER